MADKSVQSMEDELAKLRRLLQEKEATIAQLEQYVLIMRISVPDIS